MAYKKTLWKDRVVEKPNTYRSVENPDGTITLYPITGQVIEKGTPVSAANLNKIENGIVELNEQLEHNANKIEEIAQKGTTTEVVREVASNEIAKQLNDGSIIKQFTQMIENDGIILDLGQWQNVSLTNNGTAEGPNTTKLSMFDKIKITPGKKYTFKISKGYQYKIYYWNENNELLNTSRLWLENDLTQIITASYIRIVLTKKEGTTIPMSDSDQITVYVGDIKSYKDYSYGISGSFEIKTILGGTVSINKDKLLTDFINISNGDFILHNNFIPFITGLEVVIYMYDEYYNYLDYYKTLFDSFNIIEINKIKDLKCRYIRLNFQRTSNFTINDKDMVLRSIKLIGIQKIEDDFNYGKIGHKQLLDKARVGIVGTEGDYYSTGFEYSVCTEKPIPMKAGNSVYLSNYESYILSMRFMESTNKAIKSVELKEGQYTFNEDCNVHFNIVRYDKINDTSLKTANLNTFENDIIKLLILNTYEAPKTQIENNVLNVINKARSIYNLKWTPLKDIPKHGGYFYAGTEYHGVPYSSARVTDTMVGSNISFRSFLSQLKNPNGAIYTENLSSPPYSQSNAYTYVGMVCSTFVGYCLGIPTRPTSVNWNTIEGMRRIKHDIDLINPCDSLLYQDPIGTDGHVMLVGEVVRDINDNVTKVEVLESWPPTINRKVYERDYFINNVLNTYQIYRYDKLNNVDKDKFDFDFEAEKYLNVDRGNYSYYRAGEVVEVTRLDTNYKYLLVYKGSNIINSITVSNEITSLSDLIEGEYKICLSNNQDGTDKTPFIHFRVNDDNTTISQQGSNVKINLESGSGNPIWFSWNDNTHVVMKCREITGDEKINGFIIDTFKSGTWKIKVYYENDYGVFSSNPVTVVIP